LERDLEALGDPRETVTSPAVAKRDGDRDDARPLPPWYAIEVPNQLGEEVVGVQFLDKQLQECARPGELRGARGEEPHRTRPKFLPPPLGIDLLFRPGGVFELAVDVADDMPDLAHDCTSTNHGTRDFDRVPTIAEGLGRPRGYGVCEKRAGRGCARTAETRVSGPW
jgi:hypothetical protein